MSCSLLSIRFLGMDEHRFMEWMKREKVDANIISYWFKNENIRHHALGENKLGLVSINSITTPLFQVLFNVGEARVERCKTGINAH